MSGNIPPDREITEEKTVRRDDRTLIERIADWRTAFLAIRDELTPENLRRQAWRASEEHERTLRELALRDMVANNDRLAAQVAELLARYVTSRRDEEEF